MPPFFMFPSEKPCLDVKCKLAFQNTKKYDILIIKYKKEPNIEAADMATTTRKPSATTRKAASKPATTTTRSISAAAKTVAKAAPRPKAVPAQNPKVVAVIEPAINAPDMRKKELIDRVVERSGIKKKYAKPAVEAALAVLGECIAEGREMNLAPLGKVRINRATDHQNGRVTICKIRQPNGQASTETDDGEES